MPYLSSSAFKIAQRSINSELAKIVKDGRRKYYTKDDLRFSYDKFKGACAKCGMKLTASGSHRFSARFMLRVPIQAEGEINRANLLCVCTRCKDETKPRRISYPTDRVFEFNTFADLIAHLAQAVVEDDINRVTFFKTQVNESLNEFVQTLYYKPTGGKCEPIERYEGENTVADLIAELTTAFKEINKTKEYTTLRRNK